MKATFDVVYVARDMTEAERREAANAPVKPTEPVDVRKFFG